MTSRLGDSGKRGEASAQAVGLGVARGAAPYKAGGVMFPPPL